jgi:hypothetical protein
MQTGNTRGFNLTLPRQPACHRRGGNIETILTNGRQVMKMEFSNMINELLIQFPMLKFHTRKQGDYIKELQHASLLEPIVSERETVNLLKLHLKASTLNVLTVMEKEYGWN